MTFGTSKSWTSRLYQGIPGPLPFCKSLFPSPEGPVSRRGPRSNDLSKSHFSGHVKFCRGEAATHDPPQLPLECWGIILKCIEHAPAGPSPWVSLVEAKHHPPSHLEIGFGFGASFCWVEGALPLAHDEPHHSPASLLSVNEPLEAWEDRLEARGTPHGVRTDRRQEKTANF